MKFISKLALISTLLLSAVVCAQTSSSIKNSPNIEDLTSPTIDLDATSAKRCELNIKYPKLLIGNKDWGWGIGCIYEIDQKFGTSFVVSYYLKDDIGIEDSLQRIELSVQKESLQKYIDRGGERLFERVLHPTDASLDTTAYDSSGIPILDNGELTGDCGQEKTRKVTVTPISSANWAGWMWEQSFDAPKKGQKITKDCKIYTPEYRCAMFVLGNDTYSMSLPTTCFLRKKVANFYNGLSFDVFYDMLMTLRFNQGLLQKITPTPPNK